MKKVQTSMARLYVDTWLLQIILVRVIFFSVRKETSWRAITHLQRESVNTHEQKVGGDMDSVGRSGVIQVEMKNILLEARAN